MSSSSPSASSTATTTTTTHYFRIKNADDTRKVSRRQHVILAVQPAATAHYAQQPPPPKEDSSSVNTSFATPLTNSSGAPQAPNFPNAAPTLTTTATAGGGPTVRFAVSHGLARQCRVLAEILNNNDLQPTSATTASASSESGSAAVQNDPFSDSGSAPHVPEITVPGIDAAAFESVLAYLSLTLTRVPTVLGRPLHAPLEQLLHPWELEFLFTHCLVNRDIYQHAPLLKICRVADFLVIDALRDLTCAFLASLVMAQQSEEELVKFFGLQRAYTEEEFEDLYRKFPFLRAVPPSSPVLLK